MEEVVCHHLDCLTPQIILCIYVSPGQENCMIYQQWEEILKNPNEIKIKVAKKMWGKIVNAIKPICKWAVTSQFAKHLNFLLVVE